MKATIHLDITCETGGFEEVEKVIEIAFVPPPQMRIQFTPLPPPGNRERCRSYYNPYVPVGFIEVQDVLYQEDHRSLHITAKPDHYATKEEFDDAVGQWVYCYDFHKT